MTTEHAIATPTQARAERILKLRILIARAQDELASELLAQRRTQGTVREGGR